MQKQKRLIKQKLTELVDLGILPNVIYAARHGECYHNRDKWLAGQAQVGLTPHGVQEGLKLREILTRELTSKGIKLDVVISTGLLRALQTAWFALNLYDPRRDEHGNIEYDATNIPKIQRARGEALYNRHIILEERLEERNFGNKFYGEPRDVYDVRDVHFKPEGGESLAEVFERVEDFVFNEFENICRGAENAAFFIHGAPLGFLKTTIEGKTIEEVTNPDGRVNDELINIKPGSLYVFRKDLEKGRYVLSDIYR